MCVCVCMCTCVYLSDYSVVGLLNPKGNVQGCNIWPSHRTRAISLQLCQQCVVKPLAFCQSMDFILGSLTQTGSERSFVFNS